MNSFNQQPQWVHDPNPTEKQDQTAAWEAINCFFDYYDLEGAEENSWNLVLAAIGSDSLNDNSLTRQNLLDFYDQTRSLFKAVYLLYQHKEEG